MNISAQNDRNYQLLVCELQNCFIYLLQVVIYVELTVKMTNIRA